MKQREKCSGRGCESPQVHHKAHSSVTADREGTDYTIRVVCFIMGLHSFDRAKSNRVDSTVGDDR